MGGEKKPLVMSDLGCADGCGRQMGAENCADGCGRRGCKGVAGNGWGEEAAGDERPWLRGRLRTANGCGRRGCNGVAGNGWGEGKGRERMGKEGTGRERKGQEGKGRERMGKEGKGKGKEGKGRERKGKEGKGWERKGKEGKGWERERKRIGKEGKGMERTAADGLGAREWLEMGGEKKPLVMSDLGCADGCGRQMGAENCADGCGRRGCKGVAGNGWREEAAGDERPWLRGRLRTANGCGELRGRLRTAWVQRSGWKWVRRTARMAADGVGATEWLEMGGEKGKEGKGWERKGQEGKGRERKGKEGKGWERKERKEGRERKGKEGKGTEKDGKGRERNGADGCGRPGCKGVGGEKKPLVMSDLGCADGCGRQMGAENCADGCGRRGCKGVAGNGWGEEAAGDERPWLRGRLRTPNGCGELQGGGWKWVGRRSRW